MKNFTKISLIVVGGLLAAGIVLCMIASILAGGRISLLRMARNGELDFGNWHIDEDGIYYAGDWPRNYEWKRSEVVRVPSAPETPSAPEAPERSETGADGELAYRFALSEVRNLSLELDVAKLTVREGSSADEIVVTLVKGDDRYFSAKMDGSTLQIAYDLEDEDVYLFDWGWNWGVNWNRPDVSIVVEIPADAYFEKLGCDVGVASVSFETDSIRCGELELDAGVGNVEMAGFTVEQYMEVDTGTGNVEIAGGTYGDVDVDCGVGEFSMRGTLLGDMKATCGVGSMELTLTGKETDYNYDLSYGMGEMDVNGKSYGGGIDGEQRIRNEGAISTISLDCGVGNLKLRFVE